MSLLLDALKKAEKAKEEAQRRANAEPAAPVAARVEDPEPARITTRDELPDIASHPLEIVDDDIAPKPARASAETRRADNQAAERATAKKVFEAKFREPNPRMPFYITIGVLGVFALGTVGYFWYQLPPPPALVNTSPGPRPAPLPTALAQSAPPPAAAPTAAAPNAIPGLPPIAPAAAPASPAPAPAQWTPAPRAAALPPERPRLSPSAAPERAAALAIGRPPPQVHPKVDSAYAAYLGGDIAAARADYEQALGEEPGNRDALLGLAALDVKSGRLEAAEGTYLRLLQVDPRDAYAQAGLLALRSGRGDALASESRVKMLLANEPGAHVLHFTLGNQLAQQGRWAEAQQEYFRAFAADPDNADFAYNLAVSLDHLRQSKLALEYYQRALALSEKRGASFSAAAARERIAQLGR
jgi:tetratricopeptide (TPR) repeat protein